ncbi:MAG: hypothetical protein DMF73_07125 [Acidobacteria bacterium]|nr:MAG: hypothetical protein DMF73_07125 [Acidobacteriota bacterium]
MLLLLTTTICGQTTTTANPNAPPITPNNPSMASSYMDSEREQVYARFTDFKRNLDPDQQRFAYGTAKAYLRRWGGEKDADTKEVIKWVTEYERQMHQGDLYAAYNAKKYAQTFELARPMIKADPEYFFGLAIMTEAGYDNSLTGNTSLNAETADYARRAIQLLEAGRVTKVDPFKSIEIARGFLNYALGSMVKDEKPAEAAAAFLKAVKSDSPYHTDPLAYHRLGIAIYKGELMQLSGQYNDKFGGKQSSAEQTAMLNRILHLAEQAINAYARAVALSTKPEQQDARGKILAQLTTLYKSFHNNSDEGLNELIAGVLAKPIPE